MKYPCNTNNKPALVKSIKLNAIALSMATLACLSLGISTSALAENISSESSLRVASVESTKPNQHNHHQRVENYEVDEDSDNSAHHESENDNRIGAFSMKDGAMMGVYGDGEYAD